MLCIGHSNIWSKPVHLIIKTVKDKFNLQWLRLSVSTTDSPTSEKSFKEIYPENSKLAKPPKTLNPYPATAEMEEMVPAAKV